MVAMTVSSKYVQAVRDESARKHVGLVLESWDPPGTRDTGLRHSDIPDDADN
jgi:hypothetical protein